MCNFIKNKKNLKEIIDVIISSKSQISLDANDFGDIDNIVAYFIFSTSSEGDDFKPIFDQKIIEITKKLIVNLTSPIKLSLKFLDKIFRELRGIFGTNIEIVYGSYISPKNDKIDIEIFSINS